MIAEPDLFSKPEPPEPFVRKDPKQPIIVDKSRHEIRDDQIREGLLLCGAPKKILQIARRSKNAIVAWTSELGWVVYAENEMTEQRAFYFVECLDDPTLSYRCMSGIEP